MNTTQEDILNGQTNAEENQTKELYFLRERQEIEGTPFYIVGNEEKGYMVIFGKWQISEKYETPELAKNHIKDNMWKTIVQIMAIIIDTEKGKP